MFQSSVARITRACSAFVLGIHASTLESVAAAAVRRERAAWNQSRATRAEVRELSKLAELQERDAVAASSTALLVDKAVYAEIASLPFINK